MYQPCRSHVGAPYPTGPMPLRFADELGQRLSAASATISYLTSQLTEEQCTSGRMRVAVTKATDEIRRLEAELSVARGESEGHADRAHTLTGELEETRTALASATEQVQLLEVDFVSPL